MIFKKTRRQELLERLRDEIGCMYLSDLRFGNVNAQARDAFLRLHPDDGYPLSEISDAAQYLFSETVSFQSYEEVRQFRERKSKGKEKTR